MKHSTPSQGDSLDLLLDTICNTFGGILFISMLVIILLNLSSKTAAVAPPSEASHSALVENERQLRDRLETLTNAWSQRQATTVLVEPGTKQLLDELQKHTAAHEALKGEHIALATGIATTQIDINQMAENIQDLANAIAAAKRELLEVQGALEREKELRTRTAKLPKQRATTKAPVSFLLKEGCLCAYTKLESGGRLGPNTHETETRTDAEGTFIVPRVSNGLKVKADGSNAPDVRSRFRAFDKGRYFIKIIVWKDSFAEFEAVKNVIVADGFEYRLMPIPDDEKVYIGAADPREPIQ